MGAGPVATRSKPQRGPEKVRRERGDGLRTCVACQLAGEPGWLLRLHMADDGSVALDLKGKAGGRGAWVCPRAACIAEAVKRRRIGRSLRVEGPVVDGGELLAQASSGLRARLEFMLSMAQRAGRVVSGADVVERALSGGQLRLVLFSRDAAPNTRGRFLELASHHRVVTQETPETSEELGAVLGKAPRSVIGIRPGELGRAVERELLRLQGVLAPAA